MNTPLHSYKQRLVVYVVWHPNYSRGRTLAATIYGALTRDAQQPVSRGIGIPVYYRSAPGVVTPGDATAPTPPVPEPIPLDQARHTAVVVLVDDAMVARKREGWAHYVAGLWAGADRSGSPHRLLPVMLSRYALGLAPQINGSNFIRLHETPEAEQADQLLIGLTHELCRLLLDEPRVEHDPGVSTRTIARPVKVFISHAKKDGAELAEGVRDHIRSRSQLDSFFDKNDIPYGSDFGDVLRAGAESAALLVLQTDEYSTREWCQREVLWAKQAGRPVLVVHAVKAGEKRSFPYIGNVPVVRYDRPAPPSGGGGAPGAAGTTEVPLSPTSLDKVLASMLQEVLRVEHFRAHFEDLRELFEVHEPVRPLTQAPELLTLVGLRKEGEQVKTFVYPEPPLGDQELDLLREFDPMLTVVTPVMLLALGERAEGAHTGPVGEQPVADPVAAAIASPSVSPTPRLKGWTIGLSIGDSPDLEQLGFGTEHLVDATVEIARYLLASGATLAYGGDLRPGGFTDILNDLVRTYDAAGGDPQERLRGYLAWPVHRDLTDEQLNRWNLDATFTCVPRPADVPDVDPATSLIIDTSEKRTAESLYIWARCLTEMRRAMTREIQVRLLLGGKVDRFSGRYPGLAEEAELALRAGLPVYLIGGFGGCTRAIIEAIEGRMPEVLTQDYQFARDPEYRAMAEAFNRSAPAAGVEPIDYQALVRGFQDIKVEGLSRLNGLTAEENRRLFATTHIVEIVYLVLKGLMKISHRPV